MALVTKNFSDITTFTRASTGTYFDSSGVLQTAGNNVPRLDYNPATLAARGLLIEEARTNSIRNNTMQGASAGVAPTNWTGWNITTNGVTIASSAAGTENGIAYIDVAVSGTCTLTGTAQTPSFEAATQIAATVGQTWTESVYWTLVSGLLGDSSFSIRMTETDSGGLSLTSGDSTAIIPTVGNLRSARYTFTRTTTNASTAFIVPRLRFGFVNGSTYNFTLRIGLPQMELGAFATSVIPTTTTALTRSTDDARVNVLSPWYNQSAGTLFVERIQQPLDPAAAKRYINISDGSAGTNAAMQKYQTSAGASATVSYIAGVGNFDPNPTGIPAQGAIVKTALAIDNTGKAVSRDGGTVATTSVLPPLSGMTTMFIGSQIGAGNTQVSNTWIRRITYYPRRLSNAELQAITA